MDAIQKADSAVETAESALEEQQARREALRERIDALEDQAAAAEKELREAHENGDDPEELKSIRLRRRSARREAAGLRDEMKIVDNLVKEKRQAVEEAEKERALARSEVILDEARERGSRLHELLDEVVESYGEIEALEDTHHRVRSTLRRTGYDGPVPGYVNESAGVHNLRRVLPDIERALKRDRARRG